MPRKTPFQPVNGSATQLVTLSPVPGWVIVTVTKQMLFPVIEPKLFWTVAVKEVTSAPTIDGFEMTSAEQAPVARLWIADAAAE
jgi:hypothetical protein